MSETPLPGSPIRSRTTLKTLPGEPARGQPPRCTSLPHLQRFVLHRGSEFRDRNCWPGCWPTYGVRRFVAGMAARAEPRMHVGDPLGDGTPGHTLLPARQHDSWSFQWNQTVPQPPPAPPGRDQAPRDPVSAGRLVPLQRWTEQSSGHYYFIIFLIFTV